MTADQQDSAELMKVGINIPVGAPALASCLAINRRINEISPGAIVFGPDGNSSPHVTITMGQIRRGRIGALVDRLTQLAQGLGAPVRLVFGRAYRERVTGRYVMADVTFAGEVQAWRRDARESLSGFFVDPARTSDEAHLTLGLAESAVGEVDRVLGDLPDIPACAVSVLHVSVSGRKGIKTEVLVEVPIAAG